MTGRGDVSRDAFGWMGVHAETGTGVHLADRTTLVLHGNRDVVDDEVDASDIQADNLRRLLGDLDIVGMDLVGTIDRNTAGGHVAGQAQLDELVGVRHRFQRHLILLRAGRVPHRRR